MSIQLPFQQTIDVGVPEFTVANDNQQVDEPYLDGFEAPERYGTVTYRWMSAHGSLYLVGTGVRPYIIALTTLGIPNEYAQIAPQSLLVTAQQTQTRIAIPITMQTRRNVFLVMPSAHANGSLDMAFDAPGFKPPRDSRTISVPVDMITIHTTRQSGWSIVMPNWQVVGIWVWVSLCWWYLLRSIWRGTYQWLYVLGNAIGAVVVCIVPATVYWGTYAAGMASLAVLCVHAGLLVWQRTRVWQPIAAQRWLHLLALGAFFVRYAGRLYPESMRGDILFHSHKVVVLLAGNVYQTTLNRGVDIPYPTVMYMTILPLLNQWLTPFYLLPIGAAVCDALSVFIIYQLARYILPWVWAVVAAGVYVGSAMTLMATWWSFDSHMYTQATSLLLLAVIVAHSDSWDGWQNFWRRSGWALVLMTMVLLGHYGFFVNTVLLYGGVSLYIIWHAWRRQAWAQRQWLTFVSILALAFTFSVVFYYSYFWSLFAQQLSAITAGGLTSVSGRTPVPIDRVLASLWYGGIITHYGLFPVLLAPIGWLLHRRLHPILGGIVLVSSVIALTFAVFPIVTGVSNAPRWLSAIGWLIALGSTSVAHQYWRRGWAARLAVIGCGAYVLGITVWIWVAPMIWRYRPPEPF